MEDLNKKLYSKNDIIKVIENSVSDYDCLIEGLYIMMGYDLRG